MRQTILDIEVMIREERPNIDAYLDERMKLVPAAGVTRETFHAVVRELSEMMFAAGADRALCMLRHNGSEVLTPPRHRKETCS